MFRAVVRSKGLIRLVVVILRGQIVPVDVYQSSTFPIAALALVIARLVERWMKT
jgi:hypothetical protein